MKSVIDALDAVAEPLREHYEAHNGKFRLKLEDTPVGFVKAEDLLAANAKIVDFRDNNIKLLKEVDELRPLRTKFEGLDPEEARTAVKKMKDLGTKGVKDADDLDARLKSMVDEAVKPLRQQITESQAATQAERQRADEFLLRTMVGDTFVKNGGKPNAVSFVVGLAKEHFEVKDSTVAAKTGKFSTEKPGETLSVEEWLASTVAKEHDYVFQPSNGGGAPPAKGSPSSSGPAKLRPGQTVLKNPTPQELGANSAAIKAGTIKVEYEEKTTH